MSRAAPAVGDLILRRRRGNEALSGRSWRVCRPGFAFGLRRTQRCHKQKPACTHCAHRRASTRNKSLEPALVPSSTLSPLGVTPCKLTAPAPLGPLVKTLTAPVGPFLFRAGPAGANWTTTNQRVTLLLLQPVDRPSTGTVGRVSLSCVLL